MARPRQKDIPIPARPRAHTPLGEAVSPTADKNIKRFGLTVPSHYARIIPGDSEKGLILLHHVLKLSSKFVALDAIWRLFSQYISGLLQLGAISTVNIALLPKTAN